MPKLFLKHEGVTLNTYELESEKTTIGRKSDNDIQLNDAAVSSHHVCVTIKSNEYLEEQIDASIEDLGSTNGTQVNGCIVKSMEPGLILVIRFPLMVVMDLCCWGCTQSRKRCISCPFNVTPG